MRAIWKGAVSFGLVNVPVKLYSATENHDVQFRQVHREDGGRIRYKRVCSIDGEEVSYDEIAKGYETEDGQMVVLDDDDLAELPVNSSREIAVQKFVPADQIDPMTLEKSYYLEPEKAAAKPYALLREALQEADRMAVVTVSLRTRTTVAVLRVKDDVIVMQTMLWPDEVRQPDFGTLDATENAATANELKMARMLVESLSGDYDADEFEDEYEAAVKELVEAKLEGGEVKQQPHEQEEGGEVVDLLAALQASVERAKKARGDAGADTAGEQEESSAAAEDSEAADEGEEEQQEQPSKRTAKKTAARKQPAKKSASKSGSTKTTAKKSTKSTTKPTKKTQRKKAG
ncbi:MAG TPA: Ku protein [Segeticoccus sp.]|uniref:non-homologous end joining protein Ku n=1 Tax=Segeticoccus sp. TaxID=2706531 RepID=UPI002D80B34C|nr:Ku protein [Segeticoccus sp.]HET8599039.1 Ku protein [Segeticoccus sp.]